jgi:ribonucleoside-diphosphate reductase alpha chain
MEPQKNNKINSIFMHGLSQVKNGIGQKEHNIQVAQSGIFEPFDIERMRATLVWACDKYAKDIDIALIMADSQRNLFNGITPKEIDESLILSTTTFIEQDPAYGYVAGRLLAKKLFKEVTGHSIMTSDMAVLSRQAFIDGIIFGAQKNILDRRMLDFDLNFLSQKLVFERDYLFDYMGLKTLYERYFGKHEVIYFELPQSFWMRVAMGLCYNEPNKNEMAALFYDAISTFSYIPGTPTLLHSGLTRPQLSSCYLMTVVDDLTHIFKCYGDTAQLSKWSGGVAIDWSNIRACGSLVNSIKTESQGVVPFLKIANDVTAAINRSGKRRGATCVYLETWHFEIEDFIDLKKNTGDERRRTHDINTANWIPDLFMKRVEADEQWTLFSPDEVPDLHHLYGKKFDERYHEYEERARKGGIKLFKIIPARQLWRKMLTRLFETGHPWITFKDAANIRSPQDHVGVIHSSNLCTEILLNTSAEETAVCNLGSINLSEHIKDGKLDVEKVAQTTTTAIRMLDNVIDICFYPTAEARNSNMRHRPIGFGLMGFQDALYKLNIDFSSSAALTFADESMELIAYHAILASSMLARERSPYQSYKGSKWDRGIFPQDTIDLLEQERGIPIDIKRGGKLDWTPVRNHVREYGMRNSNIMAIAPTATISNIVGCFPCIEPIYKNLYVKSNMSGEFTIINKYLVNDLKACDLWNQNMIDQLKYFDGNVQMITAIPNHIKQKYKEAFELDQMWLITISATRGKWIDQSTAHNVFMKGLSGKLLGETYFYSWKIGMKTNYYLRTLGASQIEKSTLDAKEFGFTQKRTYDLQGVPVDEQQIQEETQQGFNQIIKPEMSTVCSLSDDPECEVCQ